MEIHTSTEPSVELAAMLSSLLEGHAGPSLCFLAGGSALKLFESLTLSTDVKRRTIFCMGDERVSGEGTINNYSQLTKLLPVDHGLRIVDTRPEQGETPSAFAARIQAEILKIIATTDSLNILSIQGIGADGHTAGIFPLENESFATVYHTDALYVPVEISGLTIDSRASLTPTWIQTNVHTILGYITGEAKQDALEQLIKTELAINEMPAQLLKQHPRSFLFTDIVPT